MQNLRRFSYSRHPGHSFLFHSTKALIRSAQITQFGLNFARNYWPGVQAYWSSGNGRRFLNVLTKDPIH